jgi:hypothetical protein
MRSVLDDPSAYFFHVRIFLGMIVSLALAHLIRSLVQVVRQESEQPHYWLHLVWFASTFVLLVHFWWWEMRFGAFAAWNFYVYAFLIFYALLLHFLVALLFPNDLGKHANYRDYYFSQRRWFFAVLALVYFVDYFDSWLKGEAFLRSLGVEYLLRNGLYIAGSIGAIFTRNAVYHGVFAVAGLAYQVLWIARMYAHLN